MMRSAFCRLQNGLDRFLFESCSATTCVMLRIAYALLVIICVIVWMLDGERWFSDSGVMSVQAARAVLGGPQWSLFFWIPATPTLIYLCLSILLLQSVFLLVGFYSRFQAACIFFWLVSFQHRNPLICDGEDTVFRLLAFFFIFLPLDHAWSISRLWSKRKASDDLQSQSTPGRQAWGLRLIQVEMSLLYFSAAWSKLLGNTWRDGSALYYVYQIDDMFGRGWLPEFVLTSDPLTRFATWAVVFVEAVLPIALWWRPTRTVAIVFGIGLHLTIEYSMHLFLFEWIMIVGLLSFVHLKDKQHAPP